MARPNAAVPQAPTALPDAAAWLTLVTLALVLLQCVVGIYPVNQWDADPRSELGSAPMVDLGATAFAWINVAMAAASLAAMAAARGGPPRATAWLAVITAAGFCVYHATTGAIDASRAGPWACCVLMALGVSHALREPRNRRWVAAGLAGLTVTMGLKAGWYVLVEHPQTLKNFLDNQQKILEAQGWAPGSAMAELYLRRIRDPQAVGTFGLSNVFGSVAAAMTLAAGVIAWSLLRSGRARAAWLAVVPGLGMLAGLAAVVLSKSKGAAGALLLTAVFCAAAALPAKRVGLRWMAPALLAALLLAGPVAAAVRMTRPPPTADAGERSLYVRWQYWVGAARMFGAAAPGEKITGVGVFGFQERYLLHKEPTNPEEITNTHNAFVDWCVMLGVGGAAMSALAVAWCFAGWRRVGSVHAATSEVELSQPHVERATVYTAGLLALAFFVPQYLVQSPAIGQEQAMLWALGVAGFIVIASMVATPAIVGDRAIDLALVAAAAMYVTHSQVEMTLYHNGSAALGWLLLGAAGGVGAARLPDTVGTPNANDPAAISPSRRRLTAIVCAALVGLVIGFYAVPMSRHDARMNAAADLLRSGGATEAVANRLVGASIALPDPNAVRSAARLHLDDAASAMRSGRPELARANLDEAMGIVKGWLMRESPHTIRILRSSAQLHHTAAIWFNDADAETKALLQGDFLLTLNPYSLQDLMWVADIRWKVGPRSSARELYRRAVRVSENLSMDPAKQLPAADLERALARLGESDDEHEHATAPGAAE